MEYINKESGSDTNVKAQVMAAAAIHLCWFVVIKHLCVYIGRINV
jgi:hypothetical protein